MRLHRQFATENLCYKANRKRVAVGIMWHSTGANNPFLKRYVQPDDGILGYHSFDNHFNVERPGGKEVCPHAVVGLDKNGEVRTYQILPWDIEGWHSGTGANGSANKLGYIGIEICEDGLFDKDYCLRVYQEAVEVSAYLCRTLNIPVDKVICHSEGFQLGIASNHADVMHWFSRYGKSMDTMREDVAALMKKQAAPAQDNTPDDYAKDAIEYFLQSVVLKGDVNGDLMLHSPITRQDALVFLYRARKL